MAREPDDVELDEDPGEGDAPAARDSDLIDIPFDVRAEEHGRRADLFLCRRIKRMSRNKAAGIIRSGVVSRQGGGVIDRPAARVHAGDRILLKRKKLIEAPTDDIVIPIVHEDEAILAVNKPGDLVVHPTASAYRRTLIHILRTRRSDDFLDLGHRLDKETSGLLLLTKDRASDSFLKDEFASRRVHKTYLALVVGVPEWDRRTVDDPMRLDPTSDSGVRMVIGGPDALPSVTDLRVLVRGPAHALVEAQPHTGRQHQIRLHLAHAGFPIVGDKLYLGGDDVFLRAVNEQVDAATLIEWVGHPRHALHAFASEFRHPRTRERTRLSAPLAPDLVERARLLGIDTPAPLRSLTAEGSGPPDRVEVL